MGLYGANGSVTGKNSVKRGNMMKNAFEIVGAFGREEDGVALTEYLILLALLVGGVILAVTVAGNNLAAAWTTWGTFWDVLQYSG